jgi:sulfite reductase alpha subunit-like flavoprotein
MYNLLSLLLILEVIIILIISDYHLPNLPQPCSVQYLVESYLDINCIPRRYFFELLSHFAKDSELERFKLREFASAEGQV